MRQALLCVLALVLTAGLALAGAPKEAEVQGLYEGTWKDAKGEGKIEARVAAMGKETYKVFVREGIGETGKAAAELDGQTEGETVTIAGKAGEATWAGKYAEGAITGKVGDGTFELKRVQRKSPTLEAKPPEGAIVLLPVPAEPDKITEMTRVKDKEGKVPDWKTFDDGSIQVPRRGMSSAKAFDGSFKFHVEFMCPLMPDARSQGRGNSGVFLPTGDEIQVLDSFGMPTYLGGGCGGIYRYQDPLCMEVIEGLKDKPECKFTLASLPPGEWQTYDVEYRVEMKDGKAVGKPRVTVLHNGIKIHDNVEIRATGTRPFKFQDHGNPVRYRNIWVQPLP